MPSRRSLHGGRHCWKYAVNLFMASLMSPQYFASNTLLIAVQCVCRVSLRRRSRCKLSRRRSAGILNSSNNRTSNKVSPRGRRDDISPADGSSTVAYRFAANQAISIPTCTLKSRRIYVRPRTGPQSAHLWWPAMAKMQAASVPIA